jgi:hypothetical protein
LSHQDPLHLCCARLNFFRFDTGCGEVEYVNAVGFFRVGKVNLIPAVYHRWNLLEYVLLSSALVTQAALSRQASRYRRDLLFLVTAACDQQRNASTQT